MHFILTKSHMHRSQKAALLPIKLVRVYISLHHSPWQSFSFFFPPLSFLSSPFRKPGSSPTCFRSQKGLSGRVDGHVWVCAHGREGGQRHKSPFLLLLLAFFFRMRDKGLPRRWGWWFSHCMVWEDQQLVLTFTEGVHARQPSEREKKRARRKGGGLHL